MDSLPTELLLVIIDLIILDQPSLALCNQLNKKWHSLTRHLLYKSPRLRRLSALEEFLSAVDTSEMVQYLRSLDNSTCHNSANSPMDTSTSPSISVSAASRSGSVQASSTTATTADTFNVVSSTFTPLDMPVGALVRIIDLSMLPHRWDSVHIGMIHSLIQGCPFITTLNLSHCILLRDNAVQFIAEELGPRNLKSLVLSGCVKISDLAILSLCAHAAALENLELSGCERISDISILEIGSAVITKVPTQQNSRSARILGQGNDNGQVPSSPKGISKSLRSLDLSHCTRITDTGIMGLQMGATQLTSLNLMGCYGVLMADDGMVSDEWEDLDILDQADVLEEGIDNHSVDNEGH
ncbi:hypothetical protein BC939DRAFT_447974 [Gamsiella multidivaricata]|uniref:uncharacterized protein n=1 Tax=Gamsiella multidivaricata TaxID=101098 RepID=UPI00221F6782|nr:uncharacterized protein BC939DRAFT_447974 [Gamsiella multidivaricata]KAI7825664.1 hypothetical protein BC939DRAFT_447974 [Gamsiella multidivaricata]